MARITFTDKEDRQEIDIAAKYKLVAAEVNAMRDSINAVYDYLDTLHVRGVLTYTAAQFSGSYIESSHLVGLTPDVDFFVYTNSGSGTLLNNGTGEGGSYTFNSGNGRVTMTDGPQPIRIVYFKPINTAA
jgi:hypothetical protein